VGLTKSALKKNLGRRHISLTLLETVMVEIEAVINEFISSELGDAESLTPAHLLNGRKITYLPHEMVDTDEIIDPGYRDSISVHKREKILALILQDFQKRWRHDWPITKLYLLELNKTEILTDVETEEEHCPTDSMESSESTVNRPQRKSAQRATVKMKEWARVLAAPPGGCCGDRTVT